MSSSNAINYFPPNNDFIFQTDTYTAVYKRLTGKDVTFEFPGAA